MCVCVRVCVCAGGRLLPFCVVMCAQLALSGCGFGCGCGCGCGCVQVVCIGGHCIARRVR